MTKHADELFDAANLIDRGWCTARLANDGKFCPLGAIAVESLGADRSRMDIKSEFYDESYNNLVYEALEYHPVVKALVDEIVERGIRSRDKHHYLTSVIFHWNDDYNSGNDEDKAKVVEIMRAAAQRLNN